MLINAPSIVAGGLALLQCVLAITVSVHAVGALRLATRARNAEERDAAETARLRPVVAAVGVLVVAAASWPLLIAVLDSHVGEWPGTICIQGVTRIGERSLGSARFLPLLLDTILVTKPLLLLAAAAWVAAHAILRRAPGRSGTLGPWLLLGLGTLAAVDAVAELTYLVIPKEDDILATGCCLVAPSAFRRAGSSWLESVIPTFGAENAVVAMIVAGSLLVAALVPAACRRSSLPPLPGGVWAGVLGAGALFAILAQHVTIAVVSPAVHGIASHRCGWCVLERTTFGGLALAALAVGLGTTVVAAFAARTERYSGVADSKTSRRLARFALTGLMVAAVLAALDVI